jgi:methyl-accepting chemotaxis protein PixJ
MNKLINFWKSGPKPLKIDLKNLSFRQQVSIALALSAIIPSLAITQGLISLSQRFADKQVQQIDRQCFLALGILQQELDRKRSQLVDIANNTSSLLEANPNRISAEVLSQNLRKSGASFLLITDDTGKTVTQKIQSLSEGGTTYLKLPTSNGKATSIRHQSVEKPNGLDLTTLAIIRNTIQAQRTLSGEELVSSTLLNELGLAEQANIGLRPQKVSGLPPNLQPSPEGTYDTEDGKLGLVLMATHPIVVEDRFAGVVVVGYLVNRNPEIVDHVRLKTGIPTVTLFARDFRVSTNVPYTDGQTRAVGTRASAEVAQKVLEQGQYFLGKTNIVGTNYRTAYRPLYDHTQLLNKNSKPIGIAYVGQSLNEFESYFWQMRVGGYLIGGSAMVLAVIAAILLARSLTRPIQDIVEYADAISMGELEQKLPGTYKAEMGELAGSLQRLSASVVAANRLIAKDYYEQGFQFYEKGDLNTAKVALQKAIALFPKDQSEQIQEIKQLLLQISSDSIQSQREADGPNSLKDKNGISEINGVSEINETSKTNSINGTNGINQMNGNNFGPLEH